MKPYSEGFKAQMVKRMTGPDALSAKALGRQVGLGQSTLSRWLLEAGTLAFVKKRDPGGRPRGAREKLRLVLEASRLTESELGAFLRREGVHEVELAEWRTTITEALEGTRPVAVSRERADDKRRLKQLERELARKDKALAEAAALLVLKKKAREIWGDEDDDTDGKNDK